MIIIIICIIFIGIIYLRIFFLLLPWIFHKRQAAFMKWGLIKPMNRGVVCNTSDLLPSPWWTENFQLPSYSQCKPFHELTFAPVYFHCMWGSLSFLLDMLLSLSLFVYRLACCWLAILASQKWKMSLLAHIWWIQKRNVWIWEVNRCAGSQGWTSFGESLRIW